MNYVAVFATVSTADRIVLGHRGNLWMLPGGELQLRERPYHGAMRLFRHQTGYHITTVEEPETHDHYDGRIMWVFRAVRYDLGSELKDDTFEETGHFSQADVIKMSIAEGTQRILRCMWPAFEKLENEQRIADERARLLRPITVGEK